MTRRNRNAILQCLDPYYDLVRLIERWMIHDIKAQSGALGYPTRSYALDRVQVLASSVDPMGYSRADYADVESAFNQLRTDDLELFAAASMYYKPWCIPVMTAAGFHAAPNQTFYNRLVRAHAWIRSEIDAKKSRRTLAMAAI